MRLSYHSWKSYKECPYKYYLEYIKKEPSTIERDDYHTLYGKLMQKFFELYCNSWRFKTPYIFPNDIEERMRKLWSTILLSSSVNWSGSFITKSADQIFEKAVKDAHAIIKSKSLNLFLNTKSEISIELTLNSSNVLVGVLDFIHKDALSSNITIFDGKGTDKIGKNINKDQLLFYSLLYYFTYKIIPSNIGFFYYSFDSFMPELINLEILNEFRAKLSLDIKYINNQIQILNKYGIKEDIFLSNPCNKSCKYCKYRDKCKHLEKHLIKIKKPSKIKDLGEGIINFSF